jgi:hypothetical protein
MTVTSLIFFGAVALIVAVIVFFLCFDADDRFVETLILIAIAMFIGFLVFLLLVGATEVWRFFRS